jgi:hypothetical protein
VPTCAYCGDVIGVYEPAVIMLDGLCRVTSRAARPDAVDKALACYHHACYGPLSLSAPSSGTLSVR